MRRTLLLIATIVLAVAGTATAVGAGPTVTVSPNADLAAGSQVMVSWTASSALQTVTVRQCVIVGGSVACGTDDALWVTRRASAKGSTPLTLAGSVTVGGAAHDCVTSGTCVVEVVGDLIRSGSSEYADPGQIGVAGLNFAGASYGDAPTDVGPSGPLPATDTGSSDSGFSTADNLNQGVSGEWRGGGDADLPGVPAGALASTGYSHLPLVLSAMALLFLGIVFTHSSRLCRPDDYGEIQPR